MLGKTRSGRSNAFKHFLQFAGLVHFLDDIAAADKLALDIELRNSRPIGVFLVAISLALECPAAVITAVDLSNAAISVARKNAARLGAKVDFRQSDWFENLPGESFDLIVSNPPYVAAGDPHLARDGLPFEPQMALTDQVENGDGLDCIRQIVAGAAAHLKPGGWLLFEHGYDQGAARRNLLTSAAFKAALTHPDLAGIDRVSGAYL